MNTRLRIQKKVPSQSNYTPVQNLYQTRSFGIQQKPSYSSSQQENVDLNKQYEQSQHLGYNLLNIPVNAPGTEPPPPIQTKLTIGQPGDKYEQEADQVASQVVQQINSPVSDQSAQGQTVQREEVPPEEDEPVQAKSISDTIQREEVPPEEDEPVQAKSISDTIQREEVAPEEEEPVQAKSISDTIQRVGEEEQLQGKSMKGGMAATPNLENSIQGAKGSGQPLDENIRQPMEKAFGGVDFSQVKVHNDAQSDQLNQSIQARAFTTGQDLFFRSGEYNPGSRGGQELIAHELTHVVQQNSGQMIQKKEKKSADDKPAKLHIHADLDSPGMGLIDQLNSGEVGHAWISLQWKDPNNVPPDIQGDHKGFLGRGGVQADPMGFWPRIFDSFNPLTQQWSNLPDDQRVGYSSNPFKSYVPGQMVHPDTLHSAKATQSYNITREQADAVINYAESKKNAQYSVFFYNCTTFAKEAAQAGGQSPPSMGTAGICYPDSLYKSIVKNQKNKVGTTSVVDNSGNINTVEEVPKKK